MRFSLLRSATVILIGLTSLAGAACSRRRAVVSPALSDAKGVTSLQFLNEPIIDLSEGQELQPPTPNGELALPSYPQRALRARAGAAVVLRFVINVQGEVVQVLDSPIATPLRGRYAEDFRVAAEKAIRTWRFKPAELQWLAKGKDLNGDGKPDFLIVLKSEPVQVYTDVRLDFSIVKGKGQVHSTTVSKFRM